VKVVVLIGSPRKGGNTDCLADAFTEGAVEAGAQVEKIYLDDHLIRPIAEVGDDGKTRVDLRADDDWRKIMQKVIDAQVLVLGAPVYWQGVPAQMKCFVDRWSAHYATDWLLDGLADKVWAVLCPYGDPTDDQSRWVVEPVKVWVGHFKGSYAGHVGVATSKKGEVAQMKEIMQQARDLGRSAVEAAQR
jgi:multimeric flavodoxin WrbA